MSAQLDLGHDLPIDRLVKSLVETVETTLDTTVMSCASVITTQGEDRSGDVVETAGISLVNHKKYPLVLLNHYRLIGKAEGPDRQYTVELKDGLAVAKSYFSNSIPESVQTYRLIEERLLRGVSIGFISKASELIEGPSRAGSSFQTIKGIRFKAVELLEYSHCTLQDNPDALVLLEKGYVGSEPLLPGIRKSLEPSVAGLKNRPDTISVPAEIEALKAEIARLKEKTMTTPITPAVPPVPPASPEATPVRKGDDLPPGARLLQGSYLRLLDHRNFFAVEGSTRKQEAGYILDHVREELTGLDEALDKVCDLYAERYPDEEPLVRPSDAEGDSEQAKAAKEHLDKVLAAFRKEREQKGQDLSGTPVRKGCEDLAAWLTGLVGKVKDLPAELKAEAEANVARLKRLAAGVVPDEMDGRLTEVSGLLKDLRDQNEKLRAEIKRAKAGR